MSFRDWYIRNQDSITWFLIGWLSMSALDNLVRGHYVWAVVDAGIAFINYKLVSR